MGTEAEYVSNPHSLCTPSPVDSRRQPARIARVRTVVADLPARPPEARRCRVKHRLAQLWNILKGEMSLLGPRPDRPEIAAKLQGVVPNYDRRLAVRPGISGYAQVYLPADTSVASVQSKIRLDLFYISNLSLWLD